MSAAHSQHISILLLDSYPPFVNILSPLPPLLQAISIIVPVVAGFLVSFLGQKEILTWYPKLNKPRWQPPAFLFGMSLAATLLLHH